MEHLADLVGDRALATHSFAELSGIKFSIAKGADPIEHLLFAIWEMALKPFDKYRRHSQRQPNDRVCGKACTGFCRGPQDPGDFVIINAGDYWSNVDADWDTVIP
jgi:hypothetical protein